VSRSGSHLTIPANYLNVVIDGTNRQEERRDRRRMCPAVLCLGRTIPRMLRPSLPICESGGPTLDTYISATSAEIQKIYTIIYYNFFLLQGRNYNKLVV
jgi:hypothetical protein